MEEYDNPDYDFYENNYMEDQDEGYVAKAIQYDLPNLVKKIEEEV